MDLIEQTGQLLDFVNRDDAAGLMLLLQQPRPPHEPPKHFGVKQPNSLGTLKSIQTERMDVEVDAKIVADGSGGDGRETSFDAGRWSSPEAVLDGSGKIIRFKGKFVWRATIEIRTV